MGRGGRRFESDLSDAGGDAGRSCRRFGVVAQHRAPPLPVMLVRTSTCFVNRTKRVRLPSPAPSCGGARGNCTSWSREVAPLDCAAGAGADKYSRDPSCARVTNAVVPDMVAVAQWKSAGLWPRRSGFDPRRSPQVPLRKLSGTYRRCGFDSRLLPTAGSPVWPVRLLGGQRSFKARKRVRFSHGSPERSAGSIPVRACCGAVSAVTTDGGLLSFRSHRTMASPPDSHSGHAGSTPAGITISGDADAHADR